MHVIQKYVKNVKTGRGDVNTHISFRNVGAEMPRCGSRERDGVRRSFAYLNRHSPQGFQKNSSLNQYAGPD